MIQRYRFETYGDRLAQAVPDSVFGRYVLYDDYTTALAEKESALAAERAKVRELVEALESTVEWIKNPSGSIVGAIAPSAFIPYVESLINNYKEEPNNE